MDGARDVVDEKEWRDVELSEAIFGNTNGAGREKEWTILYRHDGSIRRRKVKEPKRIKNLLDCKRL